MSVPDAASPLARVRELCAAGERTAAEEILLPFLRATLGLDCTHAALNADGYSLNSVNGILSLGTPYLGRERLFFKYHQEEDEAKGVAEYYNSKLLEEAGWPVDVPLAARTVPGEQILLYEVRADARLADACRAVEQGTAPAGTFEMLVRVQTELDREVGRHYLASLHLAPQAQAAGESLHQLFFHRLVDSAAERPPQPGGRWRSFYLGAEFRFPGLAAPLSWAELAGLRWRINGRPYRRTLGELFHEALGALDPAELPDPCPAVLGHGDAHNANVWVERREDRERLVLFDPAFAGAHLPALLAEIKPTFHNILAHPEWLYHPEELTGGRNATARVAGGWLEVEHDWEPHPLRREFLRSKEDLVWRPLLRALADLPGGLEVRWERQIRLALFCCPTLVMNLTAGAARHNPATSLLGLSIALMCGSECGGEDDLVSGFLRRIAPAPRAA